MVHRSRFWLIIIWTFSITGGLTSLVASIAIPAKRIDGQQICKVVKDTLNFKNNSPEEFRGFLDANNKLILGTRIESTKACKYLQKNWPLFYQGTCDSVTEGLCVDERVSVGRDWPLDILRRLGVLLAGLTTIFLLMLSFVFKYQSLLTLEEIRGKLN